MKHIIFKRSYQKINEIEISETEFLKLKKSKTILSKTLAIEETYEIVISNFIEFEQEILNLTVDHMVRNNSIYQGAFDIRVILNRRLVNILSAARLYIDSSKHNVSSEIDKEITTKIVDLFRQEYEYNKYYRFIEALRNHIQHRGLAIHSTKVHHAWTSTDDNALMEYALTVFSDRAQLSADKKIKKEVLNEMEKKIDLVIAVRSYIEGLSRIHESIRNLLSEKIENSRKAIENAHLLYKEKFSDETDLLQAAKTQNNLIIDSFSLLLDWDNIRIELQNRNKKLVNLSKRYVLGIVRTKK